MNGKQCRAGLVIRDHSRDTYRLGVCAGERFAKQAKKWGTERGNRRRRRRGGGAGGGVGGVGIAVSSAGVVVVVGADR